MKFAVVSDDKIQYKNGDAEFDYIKSKTPVTEKDWSNYDAVFLVNPFSDEDIKYWCGHSHLKCCSSVDEMNAQVNIIISNLEIERKYLIKTPDILKLKKYFVYAVEIEQIYLEDESVTHRIRKRATEKDIQFTETLKVRLSGSTCNEYESVIEKKEYEVLKQKADRLRHPINKTRYCFVYENQYFELDIYDFWKDKATLEIELSNENDKVKMPPEIEVISDVTDDYYYKNKNLASIRYEDY